jgi:hypothetical protein
MKIVNDAGFEEMHFSNRTLLRPNGLCMKPKKVLNKSQKYDEE